MSNRPGGTGATGTVPRARTQEGAGMATSLVTERGTTSIDDGVVAKIAGLAAREVSGVYAMGAGAARALGSMRGMVGGSSVAQGVTVEVGERQAAVDLDLVAEYGTAIPDLAAAVRKNVISAVERMCGLEVTEVNIRVDDVHLPEQDRGREAQSEPEQEPRVQ
ncbi:Asp23/Gls24 family envelope stress response protein [Nonomuraea terrae]